MSPDLEVLVRSNELTRDRAAKIANDQWPPGSLSVRFARWTGRGQSAGALNIGAHDILDDEADWNAATWLFDSRKLPRFVATIRRLFELLPEEFMLLAAWAGDQAQRQESISRADLLSTVEENRLGNRVLYRVARQ